jgi:phosphoserine aminotransferase
LLDRLNFVGYTVLGALMMKKPTIKPNIPNFSSGPCTKRPGWSPEVLSDACLGRSHRSKAGRAKLGQAIDLSKSMLGIPEDYRLGIVPASDTGAVEMSLWSLLGARGVDVLAWESFGKGWVTDITKQLRLEDVRVFEADYGEIPDLSQVDFSRDVVFTWNGTTSGVRVPNGDWIASDREGLTICDATSAAFSMDIEWDKIDVGTYSWQKVLGGEAQHGVLILSPRAVDRLESYTPPWPMPKVFRLIKNGRLMEGVFRGDTINTPSMLCVEDILDSLRWAESVGGLQGMIARSEANLAAIGSWVESAPWVGHLADEGHLADDASIRSCTSICLKIVDPWFRALPQAERAASAKEIAAALEDGGVAYDIGAYRAAPPGLRIWGGATVETSDLEALCPWLDWAFGQVKTSAS